MLVDGPGRKKERNTMSSDSKRGVKRFAEVGYPNWNQFRESGKRLILMGHYQYNMQVRNIRCQWTSQKAQAFDNVFPLWGKYVEHLEMIQFFPGQQNITIKWENRSFRQSALAPFCYLLIFCFNILQYFKKYKLKWKVTWHLTSIWVSSKSILSGLPDQCFWEHNTCIWKKERWHQNII